jgi:tripartite-type tricarboxylate transporter receptor subunit TctC
MPLVAGCRTRVVVALRRLGAVAGISLTIGAADAAAQPFPEQSVRMIVGFTAGGGSDAVARLLAQELNKIWGKAVVVENRPGADGSIASAAVANSRPDGYTLDVISNAHTITPSVSTLPYDPVASFEPITQIAEQPNILLVHPSVPVHSVAELIAYAKANPGKLAYGSSSSGTSPYLAMEMLKQMAGIDLLHVPYKGSAPALLGLLANDVQLMFGGLSTVYPQVQAGKLRAIAISSLARDRTVPDLPTVSEAGLPGFSAATWYGVLAPAGTPPAVVRKLNADAVSAIRSPDMLQRFAASGGFIPIGSSPEEFRRLIIADIARWANVVRNIK